MDVDVTFTWLLFGPHYNTTTSTKQIENLSIQYISWKLVMTKMDLSEFQNIIISNAYLTLLVICL